MSARCGRLSPRAASITTQEYKMDPAQHNQTCRRKGAGLNCQSRRQLLRQLPKPVCVRLTACTRSQAHPLAATGYHEMNPSCCADFHKVLCISERTKRGERQRSRCDCWTHGSRAVVDRVRESSTRLCDRAQCLLITRVQTRRNFERFGVIEDCPPVALQMQRANSL